MTLTRYTDDAGFAWIVVKDANIVLGPIWSDLIQDEILSKKIQNTLAKYLVWNKETFLVNVPQITKDIQDRTIMRLIRSVFAQE